MTTQKTIPPIPDAKDHHVLRAWRMEHNRDDYPLDKSYHEGFAGIVGYVEDRWCRWCNLRIDAPHVLGCAADAKEKAMVTAVPQSWPQYPPCPICGETNCNSAHDTDGTIPKPSPGRPEEATVTFDGELSSSQTATATLCKCCGKLTTPGSVHTCSPQQPVSGGMPDTVLDNVYSLRAENARLVEALEEKDKEWNDLAQVAIERLYRIHELQASLAQHTQELEQLRALVEEQIDDQPCRLDHDGFCQEHCSSDPCWDQRARKALGIAPTPQER